MADTSTLENIKEYCHYDYEHEEIDKAIKAIEENEALKNRCFVFTHGVMCAFCEIECKRKAKK